MSDSRLTARIGIAVLIGLGLGVCGWGCQKKSAPPPPPKPPEVIITTPVTQTITDFEEYTGRLAPVKMVDVRARVSGYLDEVQFTDGADIEDNAPLFRIDARPFAAALAQSEATAKQMGTRLERMRRQEERLTRLADQKVTTAEDLDAIKYQRQETDAELQAARAAVDLAKLNLEFTEIRSPLAGRISRRLVDPGNLIKADDTLLATIVALDPIYAYFDIDERTVLQIRRQVAEGNITSAPGESIPVQIALADEDDFNITGEINFEDNQISATTGTLRLRAQIDNPRKLLAPGMFVRVRLPIGKPHEAVLISEEALGSDQGQRFVYVLDKEDQVEYRRVKTGRIDNGLRVVNDGLTTADRVIVKGLQRVRPGIKVTPKAPEESEVKQAELPPKRPGVLVSQPAAPVSKAPAVSVSQ